MNLAIKGHVTRGDEVMALLEMLGGINVDNLYGDDTYHYYTITYDKEIDAVVYTYIDGDACIFTLEEFLEKFPYKVGDKVQHKGATSCGSVYEIEQMKWEYDQVIYIICDLYWKNIKGTATTENLQPYKEETMVEQKKDCGEWFLTDYLEFENNDDTWADEVEVNLGKDYEIQIRGDKTFIVKKKPQYPKTYKECCEVLKIPKNERYIDVPLVPSDYNRLVSTFTKLLICRDAYWRMAGDWKYDVNKIEDYFLIVNKYGRIVKEHHMSFNHILAFPTAEMRDAFLENFKELIEIVKEFL